MAGFASGESRGVASFSNGKRWGVFPGISLENVNGFLLPVDCTGGASIFRLGVAAGVSSFHVTNGRVSYRTTRREMATACVRVY